MEKNTKIIITGVSILALAVGGYFIYKTVSKKARLKKIDKATKESAEAEALLPVELQESSDNYDPTSHVKQIGDMIYGNNFWQYSDEVDAIIIPLSDDRTRKLAAAYKKRYKIGLLQNLQGEVGYNLYTDSENKLKSLGLTY